MSAHPMTDDLEQVLGGPGRPIILDAEVARSLLDGSEAAPPVLDTIDNAPLRISGRRRDGAGSRWLELCVDHDDMVEVGDNGAGRAAAIRWPTVDGLVATRLAVFAGLDEPRPRGEIGWRVLPVDAEVVAALLDGDTELRAAPLPLGGDVTAVTSFRSVCVADGTVAVAETTLIDTADQSSWCVEEAESDGSTVLVEIDHHSAWIELGPLLDPHSADD